MCRDEPAQEAKYVELDVRPGGRYIIEIKLPQGGMYRGHGTFREVKPPEKLVFTWFWELVRPKEGAEPLQKVASVVTVELFDRGSATEMVLTHDFNESVAHRDSNQKGWVGCFEVLARLLEAQK